MIVLIIYGKRMKEYADTERAKSEISASIMSDSG